MHDNPPSAPVDVPGWPVVEAPPQWRTVDFISDLHLHASDTSTAGAWQDYLARTSAHAVFMLGDLFDAWIGDDVLDAPVGPPGQHDDGFERRCADVLCAASTRLRLFFMRGNRDFLVGDRFARDCGVTLLPDPSVLAWGAERWLLTHGDALCLDDTDYQAFRAQVRSEAWQHALLAQPLARRRSIAADLRARSERHKGASPVLVDADTPACTDWLARADATTLVHGHTHRPADHLLPAGKRRIVLSDWDLQASPPRAQVLRVELSAGTEPRMQRLDLAQACAASPA